MHESNADGSTPLQRVLTKTCASCGEIRLLSEFSRSANRRDGHHSYCKECKRLKRVERESRPEVKQANRLNAQKRAAMHRAKLSDQYVEHSLGLKNAPAELIRLKREQLLTFRTIALLEQVVAETNAGPLTIGTPDELRREIIDRIAGLPSGEFDSAIGAELYAAVKQLGETIELAMHSLKKKEG